MFKTLTNMTGKIKYALYGVKLNVQNFILSHNDDTLLKTIHQSSTASVHRRHELGRPAAAAAFLPICVINDAGDKWRKRLSVGIRVKV